MMAKGLSFGQMNCCQHFLNLRESRRILLKCSQIVQIVAESYRFPVASISLAPQPFNAGPIRIFQHFVGAFNQGFHP